jgi:ribosome assembly protein 4
MYLYTSDALLKAQEEEELPYSFFLNDTEIAESVGQSIDDQNLSVEEIIKIVYQPQVRCACREPP